MSTETFDVAVIGGSYAGLSAALPLARARRRIAVIDAGQRRNRFAEALHGFIGHDGDAPGNLVRQGREQLLAYPTVQWFDTTAMAVEGEIEAFNLQLEDGQALQARRLVLAGGVRDELPDIEGLQQRWGRSVFHCPYCHGYELEQGRIGVIASGEVSLHHALMLPDWGQVTLFTHGTFSPDAQQSAQLAHRGVQVETTPVARVVDRATIELADGRSFVMQGLFVLARMHMASPLPQQLGCEFDEGPAGLYLRTDMMKETTLPGVFACGDAARAAGSVALAVGDGTMAGVAAHRSLLAAAML